MQAVQQSCDEFVGKVIQEALASGLTLHESVSMLAFAARTLAARSAEDTGHADSIGIARRSMLEAFDLPHRYLLVGSDTGRHRQILEECRPVLLRSVNRYN